MVKEKIIFVSGKRKSAVAKVKIMLGNGQILYNSRPYKELQMFHKLALLEPVKIAEDTLNSFGFNAEIRTSGGGDRKSVV